MRQLANDRRRVRSAATRPAGRATALTAARNLKMARSEHAYVRGSTVKFYEWLQSSGGKVPAGPPVWICGDCHIGNLGPLADAEGRVAIQIRDLDQTVIGNPAHDIIRLGLSLASAARGSDLAGVTTARMLESLVAGYEAALAARKEWKADLRKARAASIDAPSWLWSSVVELVSTHEAAYLDHCRKFAFLESHASLPSC